LPKALQGYAGLVQPRDDGSRTVLSNYRRYFPALFRQRDIKAKGLEEKIGYAISEFDRALVTAGGWVEYADAKS